MNQKRRINEMVILEKSYVLESQSVAIDVGELNGVSVLKEEIYLRDRERMEAERKEPSRRCQQIVLKHSIVLVEKVQGKPLESEM